MMPASPKVPFYGRRPTSRTTTGCQTCRQRRLKCDEAKPSCARCAHGNLECAYGVQIRWPMPGAKPGNNRARKQRAKRQVPSTSYHPEADPEEASEACFATTTQQLFLDTIAWNPLSFETNLLQDEEDTTESSVIKLHADVVTLDPQMWDSKDFDITSGDIHDIDEDQPETSFLPGMGASLYSMYPLTDMKNDDKTLFNFYACRMCPKCVVRNADNNNYRQVVLPLAYQSRLLLKAVLAVAANSARAHDARFHTTALQYQTEALQGLQKSISKKNRTSFSRLEILGIILMLCFFEIYSPTPGLTYANDVPIRSWRAHSQGVRNLLKECTFATSHESHYERGILSFLGQYFASRSVLTYTAMSRNEDHESVFRDATYWLTLADRQDTEINPFAGCSSELLGLILAIAKEVRRQKTAQIPPSFTQREWANDMKRRLQSIQQHPPAKSSSALINVLSGQSEANIPPEVSAEKTAEAFRLAALILLEDTHYDCSTIDGTETADPLSRMFQLLDSGYSIPPFGKLGSSSFLWPIFIAGCHLRCPQQQGTMLDYTTKLISGNESDYWPRNTMAERIQHVMIHVWLVTSRSNEAMAATEAGNGTGSFVWESDMLTSKYVFEWS